MADTTTPRTGIEVQLELTVVARKVGMALGPSSARMYRIKVSLDGATQEFPLPGPHFVACAPGDHALSVALGDFLGPLSLTAALTRKTIPVSVGPGEVVTVRLHGKTFTSGALEIVSHATA
jgi:hypothetical protein